MNWALRGNRRTILYIEGPRGRLDAQRLPAPPEGGGGTPPTPSGGLPPGGRGFTSTPRGAVRGPLRDSGTFRDPVQGLPGPPPGEGVWTPVPGIPDPGPWGSPGPPGGSLRGLPPPPRRGRGGCFTSTPRGGAPRSRRGYPPGRGRGRSPLSYPAACWGPCYAQGRGIPGSDRFF